MRPALTVPPKASPGDRVAVVSPSFAAPGAFPEMHERAMQRLRDEFRLVPVEFPTTRQVDAPAADRARDLMDAFARPDISAVLASIGGDDQITVLPHLDPAVFRANPKPYFGYSDNTNLLNWLWNLGIVSYHGGSTMVHIGRTGGVHPVSGDSFRAALFSRADVDLHPVDVFSEDETDWADPLSLEQPNPTLPSPGWTWHQPDAVVTGPTWGGNLEIMHWNLAANRWIRPVADYAGCVLLIETSEEMPSALEVSRILRNAGERGLLAQFPAVVVGLAKAANLEHRPSVEKRNRFRTDQREAILAAFGHYAPGAMIVFGVEIGHTIPQWVLPYGGDLTVDGPGRRITAHY